MVQSGSPLYAREAYWSVIHTLEATRNPAEPGGRLHVVPYHVYLPSFGDWGFALVSPHELAMRDFLRLPPGLKYLTAETWAAAQVFGPDEDDTEAEINRIESHALLGY